MAITLDLDKMMIVGDNVKVAVVDNQLILAVDLAVNLGPSSTGKMNMIAKTGGFTMVPNTGGVKINFNAGKK